MMRSICILLTLSLLFPPAVLRAEEGMFPRC